MAVRLHLMGDPNEVAEIGARLVAGEPVHVTSDQTLVANKRADADGRVGARMFCVASIDDEPADDRRVRYTPSDRADRPALEQGRGVARRRRR